VLDASVAAKWYVRAGEALTDEAAALARDLSFGRVMFVVPDLFWIEVGNILWKAVRLHRMTAGAAIEAIHNLDSLNLETIPSRPLIENAFEIAHKHQRSVYDGVNVAAAVSLKLSLISADERLVSSLASRFPVRWLGAIA
jgi:predicted nucleic acid-binding protein